MKHILLALGVVATTSAMAQQHVNYTRSVFRGYETIQSINTEHLTQVRSVIEKNFPGWKFDINKLSGQLTDLYGPAIQVPGNTPSERSQYVMGNLLAGLHINKNEWKVVRDEATAKAHYVDYEQVINGHNVVFTRLSFRFTTDSRLLRVKNRSFGNTFSATAPVLTVQDVAASASITEDAKDLSVTKVDITPDWFWFPVPSVNGYTLHPAWEFKATATTAERTPVELTGYIDAVSGELLYRDNEVKEAVDVQVKGMVYKQNKITPATLEPLANMEVVIGSTTLHTDDTGYVSSTAASPANATFRLKGYWVNVVPSGASTPSATGTVTGTGGTYIFPATASAPATGRYINAYYHTNVVHDFMKERMPLFTGMDNSLTANIDVTGSSCNAFYSGNSINFYVATSGCPSFAEISDIIYHEYGHGINRTYYQAKGANTMRNGALNEGHADVWAMGISKDSVLGREAMGAGSFIRRYDVNYKVYPKDIQGEVHADGEIIAGSWWDVAKNIGSYDTMSMIFAATFDDVSDGPNGMEGDIYHDVLISAILNDDNDNNLVNGTPHLQQIVSAFAKHGIYLFADATLNHQELAHQPANTPITVNASLTVTHNDLAGYVQQVQVFYRNRTAGTWNAVAMTDNGGLNFTAQIPAQPAGSILDYYFAVSDALSGLTSSYPAGYSTDPGMASQVTIPYQFGVGIDPRKQISFENDDDIIEWTADANDNATTGKWTQATPTGTFYTPNGNFGTFITQVNKDHTTGTGKCLVTGNGTTSYSAADVDNGKTTIITPMFDLGGYVNPVIEYYRWYSNDRTGPSPESNRRNDNWRVEARSNSTTLFWSTIENTYQSDYNWRRRIFAVDQFFPGIRQIQLRFIANDASTASIVEAAIDDFFIYDGVPTGIKNVAEAKAVVYPNPADQSITVKLPGATKGDVAIYDFTGKAVASYPLNSGELHINTNTLAAGQYMLLIQTEAKTIQVQKITVVHN